MLEIEYTRMHQAEDQMWWFIALRRFILRILPPHQTILDIGCGTGKWAEVLNSQGYTVIGLDYSHISVKYASSRGVKNLMVADANFLSIKSESVNLVSCVDLLEVETVSAERVIENILRVLKPGGYAIVVVAAHQWLLSEHDRAVNSTHRYSIDELKVLFSPKAELIRTSYLFFFVFPLTMLWKLVNRPKDERIFTESDVQLPPLALNNLLLFICQIEIWLFKWLDFPIGSSALIMVRKR